MTNRITNSDIDRTLEAYASTLARNGHPLPEGSHLAWGAPYGQVFYVFRVLDGKPGNYVHDVPGFWGSGGSGCITKRDLYERIQTAMRTVSELDRAFHNTYEAAP